MKQRIAIACFIFLLALSIFWPVDLSKFHQESPTMHDRHGELLHIERNVHDCWVLKAQKIDPDFKQLLLNFEDKWFYWHPGVNPLALIRASFQALTQGKIISGGSTLTMQVARLLNPGPRTLWKKLLEMHTAIRLTAQYSKDDILKIYLTLAPYGGNIHGIRAASLYYFGKEPEFLPISYKAMLVAIPQSPSYLRPDRFIDRANEAKNKVLNRVSTKNHQVNEALLEVCKITVTPFIKFAPHAFRLKDSLKRINTLDKSFQQAITNLVTDYSQKLPLPMTAACIVYNYKTNEIIAYVGSVGGHMRMDGNDMCQAVRSPGSLLKPFIYGLALERGLINPQTVITDKPINLKGYMPENFDMQFCGDLTIEEALQQSLNTPVIQVLEKIGPGYFFDWLKLHNVAMHFNSHMKKRPGLAIGLGGIGMSFETIVKLYGVMAKGDLFNKSSCTWIHRTLAQTAMPDQRFKNPGIAYKTGTSYGFRDAWSIGYDGQYVVGIWIGRADGMPCAGYHGRQIAAPLMIQIFKFLGIKPLLFEDSLETQTVGILKSFRFQALQKDVFHISVPKKSAVLCVPMGEYVYLQTSSNGLVHWYVNGAYIGESNTTHTWKPAKEGYFQITAVNSNHETDTCDVQVKHEA